MLSKISRLTLLLIIGIIIYSLTARKVYAGTYISGHTFVEVDGAKVYLEGVNLKWEITDTPAGKSCAPYTGSSRTVKTGDVFSYLTAPQNPKNLPQKINCTTQTMGYGNNDPACVVNEDGKTIDVYNNINYVFPRLGCYGCQRQTATLAVSFPDGYNGLPGNMDPSRGKWKLASATALRGTATFRWDEVLQILWLYDINDVDEYIDVDFKWQPAGPQCGEPCNPDQPGECPEECPICPPDVSNPVCQPEPTATPTVTPTPTATPGPQCGDTCDPSVPDQCEQEDCLVCGIPPNSPDSQPICMSCNCDGMEIDGTVAKGETVNVTSFAKVANPDTNRAAAKSMVFKVYKDGGAEPIDVSAEIPVSDPIRTEDSKTGEAINRYGASWSYTIPDSGSYRIVADITCGREFEGEAMQTNRQATAISANGRNIILQMIDLLRRFLGRASDSVESKVTVTTQTDEADALSQLIVVAPEGRTLQLGTFNPTVKIGCKEVSFVIP